MLLKPFEPSDCLYNPTINLTQQELMEKFNLAFYEGQNLSKNDVISTFQDQDDPQEDYLVDYFLSNADTSSTPTTAEENYFDFDTFVNENLDTLTTFSNQTSTSDSNYTDFYVNPALENNVESLDLSDIDLCESLSNESLDLDNLVGDFQDPDEASFNYQENLPPVSTISRSNVDFNQFLRGLPEDDLSFQNNHQIKSEFGHLIGTRLTNNNLKETTEDFYYNSNNQIILSQNDALKNLNDDPLLSSSSLVYPRRVRCSGSESSEEEITSSSSTGVQCQWENCYQIYDGQSALVKHIEKCHVEVKRGDEFTCFWANCPRNVKPFNARYKLLIHMRVHSGEKPNKCMFEGCNKAFSRLENLKIHQRSHTGERPYLCQFPTCTKSFSNSSDRAKHQRTHFDTKPYACQVAGCVKKYTDPSSLRKHVKNHTSEEQMLLKKKSGEDVFSTAYAKKFLDPNKQKAVKSDRNSVMNLDHNYSIEKKLDSSNIRQDLKNKISEKNKLKKGLF